MNGSGKNRLAIVLLALLTVGFYWKLSLTDQYVWFDHPDMVNLELPRLEFQAREFHLGRFPLWDPHIWMGQPLIGQTQPGPLNPLNLLFMLLPLRDGYLNPSLLNWYWIAMHFIAALGCYLLCRELERTRAAAIFAACAFSFGGFVGTVSWLDVLSGALWTPFVCLYFLRATRGARPLADAASSGLFLGIAWLSGHHEIPLLTSFALAIAWAGIFYARGVAAALAPAIATFAIAGLTAAAQLAPTVEFGRLAKRWGPAGPGPVGWNDVVSYLSSAIYSLTPRGLIALALPDQGTNADSSLFMGMVAITFVALGICSAWRQPLVRWFAALAAAATLYALGDFTPIHGILYGLVPMLNKARVPLRAVHLLNFALAVIASYGVDRLLDTRDRIGSHRVVTAATAIGTLIVGSAIIWKIEVGDAVLLSAIAALALAAVFAAWQAGSLTRNAAFATIMLLMFAELHGVATRGWQNRFADNAQPHARNLGNYKDVVAFLRAQPAPRRLRVNDRDVPVNFGDLHSIDMLEGYTAGVTGNLLHYGRHTIAAQRLFGVTHYVARQPDRPDLQQLFAGADGVNVFAVPDPLPRARAVHETETVANPEAIGARLENASFDAGRIAILVGEAPPLEPCQGDQVTIAAYAPNRVRIRARMACRGMVVLADTFYPGWQATVDGKPARIWEPYGALRGVVVDGGDHEIDFRFRPASVFTGMALSAAGVAIVILLRLRYWRRPS